MKIELVIRIALGKKFSKFINLISHSQKTIFTKTAFKIFSESVVDRESTPFSNSIWRDFEVDPNPYRPNSGRREKIKLNSFLHTSLWCLERFYEGLNGLHKTL